MKEKMYLCPNCGAKVNEGEANCSYCGHELINMAYVHTEEKIADVIKKQKEMESIPKKVAMIVAGVLFVMILIVVGMIVFHVPQRLEQARYQGEMSKLNHNMEEAYKAGDYDKLYEYVILDSHSYIGSDKYFMYRTAWFLHEFPADFDDAVKKNDKEAAMTAFGFMKNDYDMRDDFFYQYYKYDEDIEKALVEEYERELEIVNQKGWNTP